MALSKLPTKAGRYIISPVMPNRYVDGDNSEDALTNSQAMIEKGFIAETTGDFFNGDIHFGFNISRVF